MNNDIETINYGELDNLIVLIKNIHGFDFGDYSAASLKRRVTRIMELQKLSLFDLRTLLTNDQDYFESFLIEITVNVTEMFRDPSFYKSVATHVIPYLKSYQRIKVWNAGCSTGEELYSFAIMFAEENLYDRCFFYGTDINSDVLAEAKNGIYNLQKMKQYAENFQKTETTNTLSNYYTAKYNAASIHHSLKKNILFSVHNLASDGVFNEFQVISCRNVLIYFNIELQKKVIELFYNSLANFGFLCLGSKETLRSSELGRFKVIDKKNNIYQKIA
ncbi:protein-glutamate O-methyltransferase CheR [Pedobacter hiemivivus]|uniref:Protein-glutamate O-methyltransferase CheR n=1 Tax=Pedobacter hiemivivus TaxID=2530454 RepID=A0A4U1GDS9_9SPHI|nr:protein-glutamate O-methyltransferase CheR [Pedobacter hiemivivus]TCC95477.1 protein-glutamate O-methyltransferase CheR [Pedobacter hiemivivus]TKC61100.1 protein-glutamate O-methyltransferase CheR [Pedobacter hiemivivus]